MNKKYVYILMPAVLILAGILGIFAKSHAVQKKATEFKANELVQLFIEAYPQAQYEINGGDSDFVRQYQNGQTVAGKEVYVSYVYATKTATLYCVNRTDAINDPVDLISEINNTEEIRTALLEHSCF